MDGAGDNAQPRSTAGAHDLNDDQPDPPPDDDPPPEAAAGGVPNPPRAAATTPTTIDADADAGANTDGADERPDDDDVAAVAALDSALQHLSPATPQRQQAPPLAAPPLPFALADHEDAPADAAAAAAASELWTAHDLDLFITDTQYLQLDHDSSVPLATTTDPAAVVGNADARGDGDGDGDEHALHVPSGSQLAAALQLNLMPGELPALPDDAPDALAASPPTPSLPSHAHHHETQQQQQEQEQDGRNALTGTPSSLTLFPTPPLAALSTAAYNPPLQHGAAAAHALTPTAATTSSTPKRPRARAHPQAAAGSPARGQPQPRAQSLLPQPPAPIALRASLSQGPSPTKDEPLVDGATDPSPPTASGDRAPPRSSSAAAATAAAPGGVTQSATSNPRPTSTSTTPTPAQQQQQQQRPLAPPHVAAPPMPNAVPVPIQASNLFPIMYPWPASMFPTSHPSSDALLQPARKARPSSDDAPGFVAPSDGADTVDPDGSPAPLSQPLPQLTRHPPPSSQTQTTGPPTPTPVPTASPPPPSPQQPFPIAISATAAAAAAAVATGSSATTPLYTSRTLGSPVGVSGAAPLVNPAAAAAAAAAAAQGIHPAQLHQLMPPGVPFIQHGLVFDPSTQSYFRLPAHFPYQSVVAPVMSPHRHHQHASVAATSGGIPEISPPATLAAAAAAVNASLSAQVPKTQQKLNPASPSTTPNAQTATTSMASAGAASVVGRGSAGHPSAFVARHPTADTSSPVAVPTGEIPKTQHIATTDQARTTSHIPGVSSSPQEIAAAAVSKARPPAPHRQPPRGFGDTAHLNVLRQTAARLERHPVLGRLQLRSDLKAAAAAATITTTTDGGRQVQSSRSGLTPATSTTTTQNASTNMRTSQPQQQLPVGVEPPAMGPGEFVRPNAVTTSSAQNVSAQPGTAPPIGSAVSTVRRQQKKRLVWTPELHDRFVRAIESIGINQAVPKTLVTIMNVEGLTTEHVKSHLQKYRNSLRKEAFDDASIRNPAAVVNRIAPSNINHPYHSSQFSQPLSQPVAAAAGTTGRTASLQKMEGLRPAVNAFNKNPAVPLELRQTVLPTKEKTTQNTASGIGTTDTGAAAHVDTKTTSHAAAVHGSSVVGATEATNASRMQTPVAGNNSQAGVQPVAGPGGNIPAAPSKQGPGGAAVVAASTQTVGTAQAGKTEAVKSPRAAGSGPLRKRRSIDGRSNSSLRRRGPVCVSVRTNREATSTTSIGSGAVGTELTSNAQAPGTGGAAAPPPPPPPAPPPAATTTNTTTVGPKARASAAVATGGTENAAAKTTNSDAATGRRSASESAAGQSERKLELEVELMKEKNLTLQLELQMMVYKTCQMEKTYGGNTNGTSASLAVGGNVAGLIALSGQDAVDGIDGDTNMADAAETGGGGEAAEAQKGEAGVGRTRGRDEESDGNGRGKRQRRPEAVGQQEAQAQPQQMEKEGASAGGRKGNAKAKIQERHKLLREIEQTLLHVRKRLEQVCGSGNATEEGQGRATGDGDEDATVKVDSNTGAGGIAKCGANASASAAAVAARAGGEVGKGDSAGGRHEDAMRHRGDGEAVGAVGGTEAQAESTQPLPPVDSGTQSSGAGDTRGIGGVRTEAHE